LEIALQCPESRLDQVDVTNSLFALYAHKHTLALQRNGEGSRFQTKDHKYFSVLPPTMVVPDFSLTSLFSVWSNMGSD